jgi:acetyl/propionyl-CoA carboxylase alpha subunit
MRAVFTSVLVANRGEIAVRIIRTLRRMGIRAVVVTSIPDRDSLAARMADGTVLIEGHSAAETYLDVEAVIAAAKAAGCEAIHPGYGFLSERADFAERCAREGIVFIGPPPGVLRALGDKSSARRLAVEAGVPVAPGWDGEDDLETLVREAGRIGYPVMVKARGGGGGRGMRKVFAAEDLPSAVEAARREATAAFGDGGLLLEKLVRDAHHVEVQVIADSHGRAIHLGDRDCSVQRRHQKLIEESPSPAVDGELRGQLTAAALRLAAAAGYVNAGTVEFLVAGGSGREWCFLEVNPRLQVEHPVTEAVTGLDLVELQLRVAAGEPLPVRQEDVRFSGHAIEVRVNAEDPWDGFRGGGGRIRRIEYPGDSRIDSGYGEGDQVPANYDSLLAKVICHGADRAAAIHGMVESLRALRIAGVATTAALARRILEHPGFASPGVTVDWLDETLDALLSARTPPDHWTASAAAFAAGWPAVRRERGPWHGPRWIGAGGRTCWLVSGPERCEAVVNGLGGRFAVTLDGETIGVRVERGAGKAVTCRLDEGEAERVVEVALLEDPDVMAVRSPGSVESRIAISAPPSLPRRVHQVTGETLAVVAPLAGTVAAVQVAGGEAVEEGQLLAVLDAMKMEHRIVAPQEGVVRAVRVAAGDVVREGDVLVDLE